MNPLVAGSTLHEMQHGDDLQRELLRRVSLHRSWQQISPRECVISETSWVECAYNT
jgi:hypothetical protein